MPKRYIDKSAGGFFMTRGIAVRDTTGKEKIKIILAMGIPVNRKKPSLLEK